MNMDPNNQDPGLLALQSLFGAGNASRANANWPTVAASPASLMNRQAGVQPMANPGLQGPVQDALPIGQMLGSGPSTDKMMAWARQNGLGFADQNTIRMAYMRWLQSIGGRGGGAGDVGSRTSGGDAQGSPALTAGQLAGSLPMNSNQKAAWQSMYGGR